MEIASHQVHDNFLFITFPNTNSFGKYLTFFNLVKSGIKCLSISINSLRILKFVYQSTICY